MKVRWVKDVTEDLIVSVGDTGRGWHYMECWSNLVGITWLKSKNMKAAKHEALKIVIRQFEEALKILK